MWTFDEAMAWLESHIDYERKPTIPYAALRPQTAFLMADLLGRPQNAFSAIHIAGTKGKGSVARFCEALLSRSAPAGAYFSPHITTILERITVNCREVDEGDLAEALWAVRQIEPQLPTLPTYFEIMTAAALLIHAQAGVAYAAYEVGIGGRLDATRVVNPKVCVLTHIGYDHTDKLGTTLRQIAAEKAAIFRNHATAVIAPQTDEVLEVALEMAKDADCAPLLFGTDFGFENQNETFTLWFKSRRIEGVRLAMRGEHQKENAAVAVAATLSLLGENALTDAQIKEALASAWLPARLELLKTEPPVLLDGAHNDSSLKVALREAEKILGDDFVVLFGCARDKEAARMAQILSQHDVVVCSYANPRAFKAAELAELLQSSAARVVAAADTAADALRHIRKPALVCGSFYLVGEIRKLLQPKTTS